VQSVNVGAISILKKWWSSSMGFGWHPRYKMEYKIPWFETTNQSCLNLKHTCLMDFNGKSKPWCMDPEWSRYDQYSQGPNLSNHTPNMSAEGTTGSIGKYHWRNLIFLDTQKHSKSERHQLKMVNNVLNDKHDGCKIRAVSRGWGTGNGANEHHKQ
jgi:hypothetical protein